MPILAKNKKAFFDYHILERIEGGMVLSGQEVKAVRSGKASLSGSFITIKNNKVFLVNSTISPYQPKNAPKDYDSKRERQLLLSKKQIGYLYGKMKEGRISLIPLNIHTSGNFLKLEIGVAKGKKKYDKRETIKRREVDRDIRRREK